MFNVNLPKLVEMLLITFLRQPVFLALLRTYCYPFMVIYRSFMAYRAKNLYTLNHNSRVASMENVFNDRFDYADRRIYITDGFSKPRKYIYTRLENRPVFLGPEYYHNRADYADTGVDFIVWVPVAVMLSPQDKIELTALINKYRLPTKRFRIYRV